MLTVRTVRWRKGDVSVLGYIFLCLASLTLCAEESKPWPFYPPKTPLTPDVESVDMVKNEIDRYLLKRLEDNNLTFAPQASRRTLLRR